jgi:hypothetical protein
MEWRQLASRGPVALLVISVKSEQLLRWCAIEARFRLLQVCNPLVSTWLKQRLTLHRKAAGDSSMT